MKGNQTFHRRLNNVPEGHPFAFKSILQGALKEISDRTVKSDRKVVPTFILPDIAVQKISELIDNQLIDRWFIKVFFQKRNKTGQKAVREFFPVNSVYDFCTCEMELLVESSADLFW